MTRPNPKLQSWGNKVVKNVTKAFVLSFPPQLKDTLFHFICERQRERERERERMMGMSSERRRKWNKFVWWCWWP
jgi:hypothetical protein